MAETSSFQTEGALQKAPRNAVKQSDRKSLGEPVPAGIPVVGIGASAGGLEAFEAFFNAMLADSGMAFILVAHLAPSHVSLLLKLLQKATKMPVCHLRDGEVVKPNNVYVIPPNTELYVLQSRLQLIELSQPRGAKLPIDSFFPSLAEDQGSNAVDFILSGTGTDGTLGLKAIKAELGMVMVQDERSARYDGMPRSAIATGQVDFVLPPNEMPEKLINCAKRATHSIDHRLTSNKEGTLDALQKIFFILRRHIGHDFSLYKTNTICRRIERRMNLHQLEKIADYIRYLQESDGEAVILFKELLIGVTNFFRDPDAFESLQKLLLQLLETKPDNYTLRVWVAGCSTVEEAYSIAILLQECLDNTRRHFNTQICGTDIDPDAIAQARAALYPPSFVADVGPERLQRHFAKEEDGQYRINKSIREVLVFAQQNSIKDPPFTKLDLLCCRNLLIYPGTELQSKLLSIFHYSLNPDGFLFLGRPVKHFASNLLNVDLASYAEQVLDNLAVQEAEVLSNDGHNFYMRVCPYRTVSNVIDGVAITFDDITERKQVEKTLHVRELKYRMLVENSPYGIHELDLEGRFISVNPAGLRMIDNGAEDNVIGTSYLDVASKADTKRITNLLHKALAGQISEFEFAGANGYV